MMVKSIKQGAHTCLTDYSQLCLFSVLTFGFIIQRQCRLSEFYKF